MATRFVILLAPYSDTLTSYYAGHPVQMMRQNEVGELDFKWMAEYGATWRLSGELGVRNQFTERRRRC